MCSHISDVVAAAAVAAAPAASSSSGEQYYVHDAARDLHIIARQQKCSNAANTAHTQAADNTDSSSDADRDIDEHNIVLQLCVTELLQQLNIVFTVDDTNGRVTVPAASLQRYVARTTSVVTVNSGLMHTIHIS
jgi:hypothetical protein